MRTRQRHDPLHHLEVVVDDDSDSPDPRDAWRPVAPPAGAGELADLQRRLLAPPERANGSADEAMALLEHVRGQPTRVAVTHALLVATHRRFERCSRTLVHRLAASDLLDDAGLDELADVLLREPRVVFAVPAGWLGGGLDLPAGTRVRAAGRRPRADGASNEPAQLLPHAHWAPAAARRWAATRLLSSGRIEPDAVLTLAREVDDSAGGALVCGALDAWEQLASTALDAVLSGALDWPRGPVRRRALDVLAATGRGEEARARAAEDGDARVRAWQPPTAPGKAPPDGQPALFEA